MSGEPRRLGSGSVLLAACIVAAFAAACRAAKRSEPTSPTSARTKPAVAAVESGEPAPVRTAFSSRSPGSGPRKGGDGGPTQATEKAVVDGLRWLARHQNPDGSWGALALESRCIPEAPCYDRELKRTDHYDQGLTGLALLCFLGTGYSHQSDQELVDAEMSRRYQIGEVVGHGLEYLRRQQKPDGWFSDPRPFMYNEALAAMAMAEAYGLTRDPKLREPAQRAVDFLQSAQRPSPKGEGLWGWRYDPRQEIEERRPGASSEAHEKELYDADTSITAWCALALASAARAGLEVRQESMDGAMAFCQFATADDGLVGYLDAKGAGATVSGPFDDQFTYHPTTMSALGAWIRILATADSDDPFLDLAAKRIAQDLPTVSSDKASVDYYYWHAGSLALSQIDGPGSPRRSGKYWGPWNRAMVESVLSLQDHAERSCRNGGWIVNDRWASYTGTGPLYNTAINLLTLETYYRYENVFQPLPNVDVGAPAPAFEVPGSFALKDFRGRVVLVDFWSPRFGDFEPRVEARRLLAERMRGRPFVILGIGIGEDENSPYPSLAARFGSAWWWTRETATSDSIRSLYRILPPATVVVDGAGTIRGRELSWEETEALVDRLVTELEVPTAPR